MRINRSRIDSAIAEARALVRDNPIQAAKLADWAFKEAQSKQHLKAEADALSIFAILYVDSNPTASYEFSKTASEIYRQLGDSSNEAEALLHIAGYYEKSGWTCRSHFVLLNALELSKEAGNAKLSATILFDLGINAEERDDLHSALEYYVCAKISAEEAGNAHIYWVSVCAEQEMYYRLKSKNFELAIVQNALTFLERPGMEKTRIEIETFLSKVAHDSGDVNGAKASLKRAYRMANLIGAEQVKAEIVCQLGEHRLAEGKLASAKKLLNISLGEAQSQGLRSLQLNCIKLLSKTMSKAGDSEAAFELLTTYSDIREELHAHESKIHFHEVRMSRDLQMLAEESRALKQTNTELAALNDRLESALKEKKNLQKELERLATVDELTNALNRREIMACGAEIISRFHTQNRPGVVMIVDIDHFKSINDTFGHTAGDEVLRRFSRSCQAVLRPTDRFGRLGGEEFCILLDRTSLDIALKVAERVMNSIRTSRVADILGERQVTASIGIVEVSRKHKTIEAALHDADLGLYEAKRSGRDKICVTGVKKKKAA